MRKVLEFLALFSPVFLGILYLTGDLGRLARLPRREAARSDLDLSKRVMETERGYFVREVGRWELKRWDAESRRLLWRAGGARARALEEARLAVEAPAGFFNRWREGRIEVRTDFSADRAVVSLPKDGYEAELEGEVRITARAETRPSLVVLQTPQVLLRVGPDAGEARLETDAPVRLALDDTVVVGEGLLATSALRRIVIKRRVRFARAGEKGFSGSAGGLAAEETGEGVMLRLTGGVLVRQAETTVVAPGATAVLDRKGDLLRVVAAGAEGVRAERAGVLLEGRRLLYDAPERRLLLDGYPVAAAERGRFVAGRIDVRFDAEGAEAVLTGRVKGWLSDENGTVWRFDVPGGGTARFKRRGANAVVTRADLDGPLTVTGPERQTLSAAHLSFDGRSVTLVAPRGGGDEVRFSSDRAVLHRREAALDGRVAVHWQGERPATLEAPTATVRWRRADETTTLSRVAAAGGVRLTLKTEREPQLVAIAERAVYDAPDGCVVLQPRAVLTHGETTLTVKRLTVDLRGTLRGGAFQGVTAVGKRTICVGGAGLRARFSRHELRSLTAEHARAGWSGATLRAETLTHDLLRQTLRARNIRVETDEATVEAQEGELPEPLAELRMPQATGEFRGAGGTWRFAARNVTIEADSRRRALKLLRTGRFEAERSGMRVKADGAAYVPSDRTLTLKGAVEASVERDGGAKTTVKADGAVISLDERSVTFGSGASAAGTTSRGPWRMSASRIFAVYGERDGKPVLERVYAEGGVNGVFGAGATAVKFRCDRCSWDGGRLAAEGDPCVAERPGLKIRERRLTYDPKTDALETDPAKQAYDWEADPAGLKKMSPRK